MIDTLTKMITILPSSMASIKGCIAIDSGCLVVLNFLLFHGIGDKKEVYIAVLICSEVTIKVKCRNN